MSRAGQVPHLYCAVDASDGERVSVRAERRGLDLAQRAGQGLPDRDGVRWAGDVPQMDRAITVHGDERVSIPAERRHDDGTFVSIQGPPDGGGVG